MSRYKYDGTSIYATNLKTGKEVIYGTYGDIVIREAEDDDVGKICRTPAIKKAIKQVAKAKSMSKQMAECYMEYNIRRGLAQQSDSFEVEYVIEINGKFIGYAEVTCYGDAVDYHRETKNKVIIGGKENYCGESTYAGVELFFVSEELTQKYLELVCKAFRFLCQEYNFFDHLDLVIVKVVPDKELKEIHQIYVVYNIFDAWKKQ